MLENQNVKELTTQKKIKSVIDDYNDIAIEYSEELLSQTTESFKRVLKIMVSYF